MLLIPQVGRMHNKFKQVLAGESKKNSEPEAAKEIAQFSSLAYKSLCKGRSYRIL